MEVEHRLQTVVKATRCPTAAAFPDGNTLSTELQEGSDDLVAKVEVQFVQSKQPRRSSVPWSARHHWVHRLSRRSCGCSPTPSARLVPSASRDGNTRSPPSRSARRSRQAPGAIRSGNPSGNARRSRIRTLPTRPPAAPATAPARGEPSRPPAEHGQPAACEASAKAGAVVRDERDQVRIDRVQLRRGKSEVDDVLGHEDHGRSQDDDDRARQRHPGAGEQQTGASETQARLQRERHSGPKQAADFCPRIIDEPLSSRINEL
jgi:hypothetical protein